MKLLLENWRKYLTEGSDFSADTGLPLTGAGIKKCLQDSECKKRLYPPLKSFIDQFEKTLATIIPDERLAREIKNIIWAVYVEGKIMQAHPDSQHAALLAMVNNSPSSAATPDAPEAAPEEAAPEEAAGSGGKQQILMKGIERTKAALKKILANPNLTPEEKEEERRDLEQDIQDLEADLKDVEGQAAPTAAPTGASKKQPSAKFVAHCKKHPNDKNCQAAGLAEERWRAQQLLEAMRRDIRKFN